MSRVTEHPTLIDIFAGCGGMTWGFVEQGFVPVQAVEWDLAAAWTPVWIGFGGPWRTGDEPLPWTAHDVLWKALAARADHVRFHKRLGGVRRLPLPEDVAS